MGSGGGEPWIWNIHGEESVKVYSMAATRILTDKARTRPKVFIFKFYKGKNPNIYVLYSA